MPRPDRFARLVTSSLGLLLLLLPTVHAATTLAGVSNAAPTLVALATAREGPCDAADVRFGPSEAGLLHVCVRARDGNGHADLCAEGARSTLTVLLADGRTLSAPLGCVEGKGREALLRATVRLHGERPAFVLVQVEDAWGASADGLLPLSMEERPHRRTAPGLPGSTLLP